MSGPIDQFLEEVSRQVGNVDSRGLQEMLAEIRGHLEESAAGFEELGDSRLDAERQAIAALGSRKTACQVVQGQERLFESRIRPLGLLGWLTICASFLISLNPIWVRGISSVGIYLLFGTIIFAGIVGYRRMRIEWARLSVSVTAGFLLGACLMSPFVRVSMGGGLDSLVEFERNRYMNEAAWARQAIEQDRDLRIMRQSLNGNGEEAIESTKTEQGYLMPDSPKYGTSGGRAFSLDLQAAKTAWGQEANKFDLDMRAKLVESSRARMAAEMEGNARLNLLGNIQKLILTNLIIFGTCVGVLLFGNAFGVATRMIAELIEGGVRRRKGRI